MANQISKVLSNRSLQNEGKSLLSKSLQQYPFVKYQNPVVTVSPRDKQTWGYAETWFPGDKGWQGTPQQGYVARPSGIPINRVGVDVYQPNQFSPSDLAGEMLHPDKTANQFRQLMLKSLTPRQLSILQEQPDYTGSIQGGAPHVEALNNAVDSFMRGYTVGQWPKQAIDEMQLSPEQNKWMQGLKTYMMAPR